MFVILGGTGHIGSALAERLLQRRASVTIVTRDERKCAHWQARGARVAVADVRDVPRLRQVLAHGKRAFLLNPPADPACDTAKEERASAMAIAEAVCGSGLERVVLESTYGAQPGEMLGDLGVLYELEQALRRAETPVSIIRAAYYMSNWEASIASARSEGRLFSLYPASFALPMVAPNDIAELAAELLTRDSWRPGSTYIEGPKHYSPADVAAELASVLGRAVTVEVIDEAKWESFLIGAGFSQAAARSMAAMTRVTLHGGPEAPTAPVRGPTTLRRYIEDRARAG
jgi:uncharacterized protein YbjT (DUF2867 family)